MFKELKIDCLRLIIVFDKQAAKMTVCTEIDTERQIGDGTDIDSLYLSYERY